MLLAGTVLKTCLGLEVPTPSLLTWLLAEGSAPVPKEPLHRAAQTMDSPTLSKLREHQDVGSSACYNLILEVAYRHHFCNILLVTQTKPGTV